MSKKLQGNGLWESSRMMLPEHRTQILKSNKEIIKVKMPVLHEDEIRLSMKMWLVHIHKKKL